MKIEKLTENKIRIILKKEDFKDKSLNVQEVLLKSPDSQSLFLEILNRAKTEVNFDTEGHKLLIEAHFQSDDIFIFTITKYIESNTTLKSKNRKLLPSKKVQVFNTSYRVYQFSDFDDFCNFCNFINSNNTIDLKKLFKSSVLYLYNDTYYLLIDDISLYNKSLNLFHSSLLEFSEFLVCTKNFKFKLREHGKIMIKNNAIVKGIKYFA